MTRRVGPFALAALLWARAAQAQAAPETDANLFRAYPVRAIYKGKVARLDLSSPDALAFRTRLRAASRQGARFAGHYGVAVWGCGTDCVEFAIVDLKTGCPTFFPSSIQIPESLVDSKEPVTLRVDSRAVHVIGSLNEEDNAADRWYVWTGKTFELIRASALPPRHS